MSSGPTWRASTDDASSLDQVIPPGVSASGGYEISSGSLRIWKKPPSQARTASDFIDSDVPFTPAANFTYYVEAVGASAALGDKRKDLPGKVVLVNEGDLDGDGVLDHADGYNIDGTVGNADDTPPTSVQGQKFVPLVINMPAPVDLTKAWLQIDYDAAAPGAAGGSLRLWTKDGGTVRSKEPFTASGGTYVPKVARIDYYAPADLAKLGLSNTARSVTLYVEGIAASAAAGDKMITIRVDPDGAGPAGFVAADAVRLTTVRVDLNVDKNGSLDDALDRTVNYLPGYGPTATDPTKPEPKVSTGTTFTAAYVGQEMKLLVQGLGTGTVIDEIKFTIGTDVTTLAGYTGNASDPNVEGGTKDDDFSFAELLDEREKIGTMEAGKTSVPFWAKDYGGWAKIKVEATIGGNTFMLREFTVPNDTETGTAADKIADTWERAKVAEWNSQYGVTEKAEPAFFAASDDKELKDPDGANTDGGIDQPSQKTAGDALDVSREYRGFVADGSALLQNGAAFGGGHLRLTPAHRDLLLEVDVMDAVTGMPPEARIRTLMGKVSTGFFDTTKGNALNTVWLLDETAAPNVAFPTSASLPAYQTARKNANNKGFLPLIIAHKVDDSAGTVGLTLPAGSGGGSFVFVERLTPLMAATGASIDDLIMTTAAHELLHNLLNAAGAPGFDTLSEHISDGNGNGTPHEAADEPYLMYPEVTAGNAATILCSDADRKELDFTAPQFVAAIAR